MKIGEASQASGVSAKMIRYYESIRLIDAPARNGARYRVYSESDIHTLRFIKRARSLGFPIEDMRELIGLWRDKNRASADVKAIALNHIRNLERKIRDLQSMAHILAHLARHCHGDARPDCPILEDFASEKPLSTPHRKLKTSKGQSIEGTKFSTKRRNLNGKSGLRRKTA